MKPAALIAIATLAVPSLAAAAEERWYVGAGAMESDVGFEVLDESASGWKLFGGYRFTRSIAAEAGYLDTGDAEATIEGTDVTLGATGTHVSVVASWLIGESFALHARGGIINWEAELTLADEGGSETSDANGQDLYWGAGATFNFADRFGVRLEYEVPEIEDVDVSSISLSLLWRF
jgi:OOP family OmpA-OmpF porin